MVPGSNLLKRAARLIRLSPVQYYQFNSRVLNTARQWVASFDAPITLPASVQAVPRETYAQLGLDLQRNYVKIFASINAVDLSRDSSGDQFVADGMLYQIESQNTWYLRDGWVECLAVAVARGQTPNVIPG
jgi:hypothetical protein